MTDDQALHGVAVSHRRTEPIWVSQSHIVIFCTSVLFLVHTGAKRLRGVLTNMIPRLRVDLGQRSIFTQSMRGMMDSIALIPIMAMFFVLDVLPETRCKAAGKTGAVAFIVD
ncbi:predicted protein [Plenodomus lingam JN3]|uniref:Predicted protein n=1 Tax=Leptosphaeria maculans (strain JN3 / isolate v23.1.3 / race Av1-4-5-6-7-8) TaxID=985895 RepID=E5A1U9_LEPMJ|nr:predicted protein [Plenodomus lingam JN3]CBX97666.1 predicted protein [Plenodomus lingam JN3]